MNMINLNPYWFLKDSLNFQEKNNELFIFLNSLLENVESDGYILSNKILEYHIKNLETFITQESLYIDKKIYDEKVIEDCSYYLELDENIKNSNKIKEYCEKYFKSMQKYIEKLKKIYTEYSKSFKIATLYHHSSEKIGIIFCNRNERKVLEHSLSFTKKGKTGGFAFVKKNFYYFDEFIDEYDVENGKYKNYTSLIFMEFNKSMRLENAIWKELCLVHIKEDII